MVSGNAFSLSGGITVSPYVSTALVYPAITLTSSQTWLSSGALIIAGSVNFPSRQLLVQGTGTVSFAGAVSGSDFRTCNNGTAAFNGNSSLTTTSFTLAGSSTNGTIKWNSTGILQPTCLYVGFAGGVGNFTQDAGAVYIDTPWGVSMSGSGSTYHLNGAGQAYLMTRVINATAGTTLAFNGGRLATFSNASLTPSASLQYTITDGFAYLDAHGSQSSITLNGSISGNGHLINCYEGTVTLNGVGTYTGYTRSNGGTLRFGNSAALQGSTVMLYSGDAGSVSFGSLSSATFGGLTGQRNLSLQNASGAAVALSVGSNDTSASYTGALTGGGSLAKMGSGTLTISGAHSYSGATTVQAGTLQCAATNTLPNTPLIVSGGTFDLRWCSITVGAVSLTAGSIIGTGTLTGSSYAVQDGTISAVLAGNTALTKTTGGTVTLASTNSYSGLTDVQAGTLQYAASNAIGSGAVSVSGGTLDLQSYSDTVGAVTLSDGGIIGAGTLTGSSYAVQDGTISAVLAGNAALTKTTGGTVTLASTNSYSGLTDVQAGTLQYAASNAIGSGAVSVSGGTLDLQSYSDTVGAVTLSDGGIIGAGTLTGSSYTVQDGTISANLAGNAALTKTTGGTVTLSAQNTYSGGTTLNAGTIAFASGGLGASGNVTFAGNATLQWVPDNTDDISSRLTINNGANATADVLGDGVLTFATGFGAGGSGALTKTGSGTLVLSGANTYTGGTTINGGLLVLPYGSDHLSATGAITVVSGQLSAYDQSTSGAVSFQGGTVCAGTITKSGTDYDCQAGDIVATLAGDVGLTKTGAGTANVVHGIYTGTTSINGGTLEVGTLSTSQSTVYANDGGVLAGHGPVSRPISIASGGTLSPAGDDVGSFQLGQYPCEFSSGSTLRIDIDGNTDFDQLQVGRSIALNGCTLVVDGTYTPPVGSSIRIIRTNGYSPIGQFSNGSTITVGGVTMTIDYNEGYGVALRRLPLQADSAGNEGAAAATLVQADLAPIVDAAVTFCAIAASPSKRWQSLIPSSSSWPISPEMISDCTATAPSTSTATPPAGDGSSIRRRRPAKSLPAAAACSRPSIRGRWIGSICSRS